MVTGQADSWIAKCEALMKKIEQLEEERECVSDSVLVTNRSRSGHMHPSHTW